VFLEKRVVLAQKFPPLKTGREWSYYEHITSAILDQKRDTAKVCRSSGIGKLFEFIEESATNKKFSPPIFSPPLPGGHGRGGMPPGATEPGPGKRDGGTDAPRRDLDTAVRSSGDGRGIRF